MEFFNTPIESPIIIIITIIYFLSSSITMFDIRINQAIKEGIEIRPLPNWVAYLYWLNWLLGLLLIMLNWKYAILVFVIRFIFKVLPVLEIVGNFIMSPFKNIKLYANRFNKY